MMKSYDEILSTIQESKTLGELQAARQESNYAELNGKLSMTEIARLSIARFAMRKALAARNYWTTVLLINAFAEIHQKDFDDAQVFFEDLLARRKNRLFLETTGRGQTINRLFVNNPKLVLASIDRRFLA